MTETNNDEPCNTDEIYRVGLTGGIASGKSTAADFFGAQGIPVIDTDVIARDVVRPGQPALDEIRERFGDFVIDAAGNLDRAAMRSIVFADDDARLDLESILHPRIGAEVRRQADVAGGPYQVIVVPLLVDSPLRQFVDRVLVVDCNEDTQLERLLRRDGETIERARRILAAQSSREERLSIADDVLQNDRDVDHIRQQVTDFHQQYLELAKPRGQRES